MISLSCGIAFGPKMFSGGISNVTRQYDGSPVKEEDKKYSLDSQTYLPRKSDDLLSFVVMVLTLLVPHCFEAFDYAKVIDARNREFKQLRHLWKKLRSSGIWGPIVEAAELEDISKLEKILEIFVVL